MKRMFMGASLTRPLSEADDGSRTRDLELGKLALYQLSYVRSQLVILGGTLWRLFTLPWRERSRLRGLPRGPGGDRPPRLRPLEQERQGTRARRYCPRDGASHARRQRLGLGRRLPRPLAVGQRLGVMVRALPRRVAGAGALLPGTRRPALRDPRGRLQRSQRRCAELRSPLRRHLSPAPRRKRRLLPGGARDDRRPRVLPGRARRQAGPPS